MGLGHAVVTGRRERTREAEMVDSKTATQPERLIPRWFTVVVISIFTVLTLLVATATVVSGDGLADMSMYGIVAFGALMLVASVSSLARPRRRREPEVLADGTRVFRAPALTVWPLVGAWVAIMCTAVTWGVVMLDDFSALESPGFSLVVVIGAVGLIPDFVRLLTGRLHRWTLILGPDDLTYRGYRTNVSYPWKEVSGAKIQRRGPAGVRIDLRGAQRKDPVVPITAFPVPAEQLIEEILGARKAGRR
jgi:hypothetical protein